VTLAASIAYNGQTAPYNTTALSYYDTNATFFGSDLGSQYIVATTQIPLPSSVRVGDAGTAYVANRYTNSGKTTLSGTVVNSYAVQADTANTAQIQISSTFKDNLGAITETDTDTYRITSSGVLTLMNTTASSFLASTSIILNYVGSGAAVSCNGATTYCPFNASSYSVSTLAGTGALGSTDGLGATATFTFPLDVAVDVSGNLYIGDRDSHKVRKISPSGIVSTLAGTGAIGSADGAGATATFSDLYGVAVDTSGTVYVADQNNEKIRKITSAGVVSTLAGTGSVGSKDGAGTTATFSDPIGVAVDKNGNVYVTDAGNNKIRKITPAGVVSTVAGTGAQGSADGVGATATFSYPEGVAVDSSGVLYVSDFNNHKIRKITPAGVVSTLAGTGAQGSADGAAATATFSHPRGIALDADGNIYVVDSENNKIRKITAAGVVSTIAGTGAQGSVDGAGATATFTVPWGIALDASGNLYVVDWKNSKIRKLTPQ